MKRLGWFLVLVVSTISASGQETRNWVVNGTFDQTERIAYPWHGVDASGHLRKSVALPGTNPFVTKSNQFSYTWMGTSASFVDLDGDGLSDIVSPDGAGIFWYWKNVGTPGNPAFNRGEVIPLLVDDQRSQFVPLIDPARGGGSAPRLSPSEEAARRRVDERRARELERLTRANDRRPESRRVSREDLQREVEEKFPYDEPPAGSADVIPPGGLSVMLNSFRRLRAVAAPGDWNSDGLTDFLVGDSNGIIYVCRNSGRPGAPVYGHFTAAANRLPLKTVRVQQRPGSQAQMRVVEFLNYAMPFVCDWNGNGVPDLLVGEGTYSVNALRWFPDAARLTPGAAPREVSLYFGGERTFLAPFAFDWDGDGDLDLFVNDDSGRVTVHRRNGAAELPGDPEPLVFDSPTEAARLLAYSCPQPCDWNADGVMDLIWGDPFGRICIALGKERGGLEFGAPQPVRSQEEPQLIEYPVQVSVAGAAANGARAPGGTRDAQRYLETSGRFRQNLGGWPRLPVELHGLIPPWDAGNPPSLKDASDWRGGSRMHGSWAIAPFAGDVTEVVDESGAPGEGRTLVVRWHDVRQNALFRSPMPQVPKWTPGISVVFNNGRTSEPRTPDETKARLRVRFHAKLEGTFTRMEVRYMTHWQERGEILEGHDAPVLGPPLSPPPVGRWFPVEFTSDPGRLPRAVPGILFIELVGRGELRIRDVKCEEL